MPRLSHHSIHDQLRDQLCRVARERLGATDVSIIAHAENLSPRLDCNASGAWFGLCVQLGGGWKFLGRRRTKQELLDLLSTIDPAHVDGKRLG